MTDGRCPAEEHRLPPNPSPCPMVFGVLADVHGNFEAMRAAIARHPEVPFWLCVGDLASRAGEYPQPEVPVYWIKGNNENFDAVAEFASGRRSIPNLHYIPNGHAVRIDGLTVAGLGGTYAPTWYEAPAASLPRVGPSARRQGAEDPAGRDDRRRHFVREEVEACKRLGRVDIVLTHEGPRPLKVLPEGAAVGSRPVWVGKVPINEVLAAVRPALHFCGHHHRYVETRTSEEVVSICVDRISRSYVLVRRHAQGGRASYTWKKFDQPA
jgi:uncharacterized protein